MFQKISKKITNLFLSICLWTILIQASSLPSLKMDGANQMVEVWQEIDAKKEVWKIMGRYAQSSDPVTLTNPQELQAIEPVLAVSAGSLASTRGAVVWKAFDLSNGQQMLQAATLTDSGWLTNSGVTISSILEEVPGNEYNISISDDGQIIVINWRSYMIGSDKAAYRCVKSTDGGINWTSPSTIGL